jgi:hypothetical protein
MRQTSLLPCALALGFLLLAKADTRADFISWSYNWTHTPAVVPSDGAGSSQPGHGTGGITLTNHQGGTGSGNSDVVATEITTFSSASVNAPDHFTNTKYSLILGLTDSASHRSGMLTFNGVLNGTLSLTSANIKNTFAGPLTQRLDLGGNLYTVTIGPYAAPGIPDATQTGSISAHISVQPDAPIGGGTHGGGGGVQGAGGGSNQAPEPSTLLLAALGLSALALAGWWRLLRDKHMTCETA